MGVCTLKPKATEASKKARAKSTGVNYEGWLRGWNQVAGVKPKKPKKTKVKQEKTNE